MDTLPEVGSWIGEVVARRKDGSTFNVQLSAGTIVDGAGMPISIMAFFVDVTDRKLVEGALLVARDSLHGLIDSSPLAIYSLEREGNVKSWNAAAERIFGWSEEEVMGQKLPVIPSGQEEEYLAILDKAFKGETYAGVELIQKRGEDTLFEVNISAAPMKKTDGEIEGVMAVVEDVSEQRRMEKKIIFQASLLDQVKNAVVAIDLMGNIIYWNRFAEALFEWKAEDVVGRSIFEIRGPLENSYSLRDFVEKIKDGGHYESEMMLRRKDAKIIPVYMVGSAIEDGFGDESGFLLVALDISRLTRLEEKLRDSYVKPENAYLELKEYDEERSEFISMVSHELGTPITVINSYIEMFQAGMLGELDEKQKEKIMVIGTQIDQIMRLVQDILDTSRTDSRRFRVEVASLKDQEISLDMAPVFQRVI